MGFDGVHKPGQETEIEVMNAIISRVLQVLDGCDIDLSEAATFVFYGGHYDDGLGAYVIDGTNFRVNERLLLVEGRPAAGIDFKDAHRFFLPQFATGDLPAAGSVEGSLVYDTTVSKLKFSNGAAWETVTSS